MSVEYPTNQNQGARRKEETAPLAQAADAFDCRQSALAKDRSFLHF